MSRHFVSIDVAASEASTSLAAVVSVGGTDACGWRHSEAGMHGDLHGTQQVSQLSWRREVLVFVGDGHLGGAFGRGKSRR